MNNKLFNDLLNARGKINKVIALRQEFSDINIKLSKYDNLYDVRSNLCGGPIFQSIVIEIVTVLLVALGSIILQQFKEPTKAENLLFRDLAIWAPVVLIVLNLIRRPFAKKKVQKEADEWWENEATPQIIALKRRRKEVQQELNDIITNDVILSDLSQSMQNDNDIFKLLRIVERGRANTLQSAISVYYDDYERQERYEEARAQRQQLIEENQKLRSEIQNTEKTLQQINDLQEYEYWRGQSR